MAGKQTPSFPHAFGGVVAHGCAVNGAKDANPVKQWIQFISYEHLHNGLLTYPDSSFPMDFHPMVRKRCVHAALLRQKHGGMTSFVFPSLKEYYISPTDSAEEPFIFTAAF